LLYADVQHFSVKDVKDQLQQRGLLQQYPTNATITANKDNIYQTALQALRPHQTNISCIAVARCMLALWSKTHAVRVQAASTSKAECAGPPGTGYVWHLISPDTEVVMPPTNRLVPDEAALGLAPSRPKHQYTGVCNPRVFFSHPTEVPLVENGVAVRDDAGALKYMPYNVGLNEGGDGFNTPNPAFMKASGLTSMSHPVDYCRLFFSRSEHVKRQANANATAMLNNREPGQIYSPDAKSKAWKNFTVNEAIIFHALRRAHGLCPCPQLNFKLKSFAEDPWNSNELVRSCFPQGGGRERMRLYRAFCRPYNPLAAAKNLTADYKAAHPNWRTEDFLSRCLALWGSAMTAGEHQSTDEMVGRFQGRSRHKTRCKFKAAGDSLFMDSIASHGYTFQLFPRWEPVSETGTFWDFNKWLPQKGKDRPCPLYMRVLVMFHRCLPCPPPPFPQAPVQLIPPLPTRRLHPFSTAFQGRTTG
jgi:hypothetical protein